MIERAVGSRWSTAGWTAARTGVVVAMLGLVAACASVPAGGLGAESSPEAKAAAVRQRAEARWALVLKGDLVAAYDFLSAASKAKVSLPDYILRSPRGIRAVSITAVECDAESCTVRLEATYDTKMMKGIVTPGNETWVIDNGQAWYVFRL